MQMKTLKNNIVVYILIVLGLISALVINYQRHSIERVANQVEIMMDYEDLAKLASISGKTTQQTLADFKKAGVTTLNVYDTNLEKLNKSGIVSTVTNSQLLDQRRLGGERFAWANALTDKQLMQTGVYVVGEQGIYWNELKEDVKYRFADSRIIADGAKPVLFIPGDTELVMVQHLGLPTQEMKYVIDNGFLLTVRPMNYDKVSEANINSVFKRIDDSGVKVTGIHFTALNSLGAENQIDKVAAELKKRDITLAMAEHFLQLQFAPMLGIEKFPEKIDYKVARLYVIDKRERGKISVKDATRRFAITDIERNIRINFLHNFEEADPDKTLYETNLDYVQGVADSVKARGFTLGRASTFAPYFPNKMLFIPIIFGAVAACVLYLSLFFNREKFCNIKQGILTVVVAGVLCVPVVMGGGLSVRQLIAFASAVIFPVLSMIYIIHLWDKAAEKKQTTGIGSILLAATWQITLAVAISLVGGMYLAAILGDVRFFLELDIYRGVKATFMAPIILVAFYYVFKHNIFAKDDNNFNLLKQIKELLNIKLNVKVLAVFGILGFIAWVFIGRSGHTAGVPVPAWEIKLRLFLEEVMYARPREKEFMIGHVAFFLAALASIKRYPHIITLAFVCGATIGQGSLVQTFAHMRTPVFMSTIRAIDGWALGIPIGIVVALIFNYMYPYLRKIESELSSDE